MISPTSCFAQVLSLIDRPGFERAVRAHGAERYAKGFSSWDQCVAMVFCQMASANSLREISGGLAMATGKLSHLGLREAPARSTLAYANAHRPWEVYRDVFESVLARCQQEASRHRRTFRFKHPLRIIDATTIELCATIFDWARFRRTKGAIKLHVQLQDQGCLPCWVHLTDGATHDVKVAQTLTFAPGTIVVVDRGYVDFAMFAAWTAADVWFVTRAKEGMACEVVEQRAVPQHSRVVRDEEIWLTVPATSARYPERLRRVTVRDAEKNEELVFLTNHFGLGATTIARIYKERWQIELFFKALKQHLTVKTFVGTSENAVQIQIWTALISLLLLRYLQLKATFGWSLSNLAAMFRMNLLTYRDLWAWLDAPFETPVLEPAPEQLVLLRV